MVKISLPYDSFIVQIDPSILESGLFHTAEDLLSNSFFSFIVDAIAAG